MKLKDKSDLVTSAASGIGNDIALLFAREGAEAAVADLDQSAAEATAYAAHVIGLAQTLESARNACQRAAGSSTPVACDLADVAPTAIAELGR